MRKKSVIFFHIFCLLMIVGCSRVRLPERSLMEGLASPIALTSDTTEVDLSKYFIKRIKIEKINTIPNIKVSVNRDNKKLTIIKDSYTPPLSNLHIVTKTHSYDILLINRAFNVNTGETPFLTTSQIKENRFFFYIDNPCDSIFAYVNNQLMRDKLVRKVGKRYMVKIPASAKRKAFSSIRIYAFNFRNGISNDLYIPLYYGKIIKKPNLKKKDGKDSLNFNKYILAQERDILNELDIYRYIRDLIYSNKGDFSYAHKELREYHNRKGWHRIFLDITCFKDKHGFYMYVPAERSFLSDKDIDAMLTSTIFKNRNSYENLLMLNALLLTMPGVYVSYYCDEIYKDFDRIDIYDMRIGLDNLYKEKEKIKQSTARIVRLRRNNMALAIGDTEILLSEKKRLAFLRSYFRDFAIVVINKSPYVQTIKLEIPERFKNISTEAIFDSKYEISKNTMLIQMKPNSVEIIKGRVTKVYRKLIYKSKN